MATNFEKFLKLLQELFQLDQADLDFGIYRIMNQKRDEVTRFLKDELPPKVKAAFEKYKPTDRAAIQTELDDAISQARALGVNDPEQLEKVRTLRERLGTAVDVTALENEVYSHLTNFFRRYYDAGDFISMRRYKRESATTAKPYAIPYAGEEVKLHWANADQYYIKSTETFRDYTFTVPSGKRVRVHLVAATTEQDDKKPTAGKERRFVLSADEPVCEENGELYIRFEYKETEGKAKQDDLNEQAIAAILKAKGIGEWATELGKLAPTDGNSKRTVLEKHLTQYTARNTFDYFIHKDLGGFLRRELDFFIKNEVMHLDDVENESAPKVEQYLSQIKVIRSIAHKIIAFLEQLENFQKKLWLKKKFVIETNYCVTLDRVPEELYPEIAKNDKQREEWVKLFAIGDGETNLFTTDVKLGGGGKMDQPVSLTVEFLKENPALVLDTKFLTAEQKIKLLASLNDLDANTTGVLVNSDSFHALNLLHSRYRESVKCIYIDPPYNTGSDGFIYRDAYQHSSWLAMIENRLALGRHLMQDDASIWVSIDDNELPRLTLALGGLLGYQNEIANVIWQKVFSPKNSAQFFSDDHEYIVVWARNKNTWRPVLIPRSEEADARYANPDEDARGPWTSSDLSARNAYNDGEYEVESPAGNKYRPTTGRYWSVNKANFDALNKDNRIWWGSGGGNMPRLKRFLSEVKQGIVPQTLWFHEDVGNTQEAKKELLSIVTFDRTADVLNTVKPTGLIRRVVQIGTQPKAAHVVLDFFAGSGTTGHAVLKHNAEDGGNRRFVLVEMGSYCDQMTKQRVVRALHSPDWNDGKPAGNKRGSGIIKYFRLESYEDTLNNLKLKRTAKQESLLDNDDDVREEYLLSYMLDLESRDSLLNLDGFRNPDEYTLRVERDGETQSVTVDLVETFNWLLGLTVKHIDRIGAKDTGFVRVVEGTNPAGERVLVLWRNTDETDSDKLDKWFRKQRYSTQDLEFDLVYVNGDNNLENLRRGDQTWKVRLIEEEFQRLMFEVTDADTL